MFIKRRHWLLGKSKNNASKKNERNASYCISTHSLGCFTFFARPLRNKERENEKLNEPTKKSVLTSFSRFITDKKFIFKLNKVFFFFTSFFYFHCFVLFGLFASTVFAVHPQMSRARLNEKDKHAEQ